MGKRLEDAINRLKKMYYRYNAENRAHKYIEKEKLQTSPRYPGTEKAYEEIKNESSHVYQEIKEKNLELDKHLQKVYIKSEGKNEEIISTKPLPQIRYARDTGTMFVEPAETQEGYTTLSRIVKFITDHSGDPDLWSAESVAKNYKLDKSKVENVLKYYSTFLLYVPDLEADEEARRFAKRVTFFKTITGGKDLSEEDKKN